MKLASLYIDVDHPELPTRRGAQPLTTAPGPGAPYPHQQLTDHAPQELADLLVARAAQLPGVSLEASCVSVPGATAFHLSTSVGTGPSRAFQCGREFAHVHPVDGSLHVALPDRVREAAIRAGWGEPHPISGTLLLFGPRTPFELEVVWQLVIVSYRDAVGDLEDVS